MSKFKFFDAETKGLGNLIPISVNLDVASEETTILFNAFSVINVDSDGNLFIWFNESEEWVCIGNFEQQADPTAFHFFLDESLKNYLD